MLNQVTNLKKPCSKVLNAAENNGAGFSKTESLVGLVSKNHSVQPTGVDELRG